MATALTVRARRDHAPQLLCPNGRRRQGGLRQLAGARRRGGGPVPPAPGAGAVPQGDPTPEDTGREGRRRNPLRGWCVLEHIETRALVAWLTQFPACVQRSSRAPQAKKRRTPRGSSSSSVRRNPQANYLITHASSLGLTRRPVQSWSKGAGVARAAMRRRTIARPTRAPAS